MAPNSGAGNVISGNSSYGIALFSPVSGVLVQGNLIGTDATGTTALGNSIDGVEVFASGITIGGRTAGSRNMISSNAQGGIALLSSGNLVQGNFIGTDQTGANALGNTGDGVVVNGFQSADNTIGGTAKGAGNVIEFNSGVGVDVLDSFSTNNVGNSILSNLIYSNAKLGIDLGGDGVTPNHTGGLIPGPNGFENFPVLTSAVSSSPSTVINGSLNAAASETFTIQFFANPTADSSGFGQGQIFLGSISVKTDSSGNTTFKATFKRRILPRSVRERDGDRSERQYFGILSGYRAHAVHASGREPADPFDSHLERQQCVCGSAHFECRRDRAHRPGRRGRSHAIEAVAGLGLTCSPI